MKTKEPLNTNTAVQAPDTLSVFREHYLQIVLSRSPITNSAEIKRWIQYRNSVDQILFQN